MSLQHLKCVFGQLNFHVGDWDGNADKIIEATKESFSQQQAQLIIFPELALCAYPPEDLLLRSSLKNRVDVCLERIKSATVLQDIYIILGFPEFIEGRLFNSACVLYRGKVLGTYQKQCLPNYQVFDEKRYFHEGKESKVFDIAGIPIAINICEDIWFEAPARVAKEKGAALIININASPYHLGKQKQRQQMLALRSKSLQMPVIYGHCVGAQDELVFDGGSMIYDKQGELVFEAPRFQTGLFAFEICFDNKTVQATVLATQKTLPAMNDLEEVRQALVLGLRDYVQKNGFKGVVLGLSGGIDSALTLALAVEALGKDKVEAVMMPFRYTSQMSLEDAQQQAASLGVHYQVIPIEKIYSSFLESLAHEFAGRALDKTEENLQARCRGVILMALSNKKGSLVLTTGNKSEMAVGYSTLYGDMAGGFDVLKDVAKTLVFDLAHHINKSMEREIIPQRVIDRPPSAELAPGQTDEASLGSYAILDQILSLYIEQDESAEAIIAKGFDREQVYKVLRMVDINEYKRRQAPIGTRITERGFGKDRRYPITNAWKIGD